MGQQMDIFSSSSFSPPPTDVFLLDTENVVGGGGRGSLAVYAILFLLLV